MQVNCVGGIANGAEDGTFPIVGVRWHRLQLIAVRSDHDMIVTIASTVTVVDDDTARRPFDRCHGAAQSKLIPAMRISGPSPFSLAIARFRPVRHVIGIEPWGDRSQDEILVRLPRARITAICKKPRWNKANFAGPVAGGRHQFKGMAGRGTGNRAVRAMIPRVGWQSGTRGSITPVNVSQAVSTRAIRESVWRFSQRLMPGITPGGGRM